MYITIINEAKYTLIISTLDILMKFLLTKDDLFIAPII